MSSTDSELGERFGNFHDRLFGSVEAGCLGEAEKVLEDLFVHVAQDCDGEFSRSDKLNEVAGDCEESGDWAGAESAYKQILGQPNEGFGVDFLALCSLSALCCQLDRRAEAMSFAAAAVVTAAKNDLPIMVATSLASQARLFIQYDQLADARLKIAEALMKIGEDRLCNNIRAHLIIRLAHCQAAEGELSEAEASLAEASSLLGNWKDFEIAAGVQSDMACWWSVKGMIHTAKHEPWLAVEAWQQAVDLCRRIDSMCHCRDVYTRIAIARMVPGLANALRDAGRIEEAEAATAEAEEILASLGLPST